MRLGKLLNHIACAVVLCCLGLLPFLWGGRQPMALGCAGLCALIAFVLWFGSMCLRGVWRVQRVYGLLLFGLLLFIGCVQLAPSLSALVMSEELRTVWQEARSTGIIEQQPVLVACRWLHAQMLFTIGIAAFLYFICAQLFAKSKERVFWFACALGLSCSLCALLSLVQYFGGYADLFFLYKGKESSVSGPYFNKNHFAQLQAMGALLSLGCLLSLWQARRGSSVAAFVNKRWAMVLSFLLAGGFLFSLMSLWLSGSRAGILCAAVGFLAFLGYIVWTRRLFKKISWPLLALILLAFCLSAYGLERMTASFEQALAGENKSALLRLEIWQSMRQVLALSPWFGTGFGSVRALAPLFDLSYMPGFVTYDAHNDYLELAISCGIPVALCVCVGILIFLGRTLWLGMQRNMRTSSLHPLFVGSFLALVVALGHECFDYGLKQPANLFFFSSLCLVLATLVRQDKASMNLPISKKGSVLTLLLLAYPLSLCLGLCTQYIHCGVELWRLSSLQEVPEVQKALTLQGRMQAIVARADKALVFEPEQYEALKAKAEAKLILAQVASQHAFIEEVSKLLERKVSLEQITRSQYAPYREQAFAHMSEEKRMEVATLYEDAAKAYALSAHAMPLSGIVYSFVASCQSEAEVWRGQKASSLPLSQIALRLYPKHSQVIYHALVCVWRAWQTENDPLRRQKLLSDFVALAQSLGSQQVALMTDVYVMLWAMRPDVDLLAKITAMTLRAQEQLALFLESKGFWQEALEAWRRSEKLNSERPDEESVATLGIIGFLEKETRSQEELELIILDKQCELLMLLGQEQESILLQERKRHLLQREYQKRLLRAESLMAQGDYLLAEEILKTMPDEAKALVRLAEILWQQARFEGFQQTLASILLLEELLDADTNAQVQKLIERAQRHGLDLEEAKATLRLKRGDNAESEEAIEQRQQ